MKVGVITPTMGNRPRFLAQCKKYIERQTFQPHAVEIVDDAQEIFPTDLTWRYKLGFERILKQGVDLVVVFEDDDWYPANYIESVVHVFSQASTTREIKAVGFGKSIYYHIVRREYRILKHPTHSSMMATSIAAEAIKDFRYPPQQYVFLDLKIWQRLAPNCILIDAPDFMPVGIKHGFSQFGGSGHKDTFRYEERDENFEQLEKWVGPDIEFYRRMAEEKMP